jgi:hypothetical protein
LLSGWGQKLVEVAERFIDGSASRMGLDFATDLHRDAWQKERPHTAGHIAAWIANTLPEGGAWAVAWNAVSEARRALRHCSPPGDTFKESAAQAALVRDIIGNPFRTVTLDPAWRTPEVLHLARHCYDRRAFDRLPELADALEEAASTEPQLLGHFRGPGPHLLGCWGLDLLLGKE